MFSSRSVQIAAVFSDVFGQALPNLCRSFYNETKAEMFFSVFAVALLAEGVDRNLIGTPPSTSFTNRPPHGEHTSNPLSIRLHSPSFLQAGHRFGGRQPFPIQTSGGTVFCDPAAGLFCVGSLLQAPAVQTAEDAARRGEHIGHLIFLHDSGQIPAVTVITQQANPAELCCKVHLLR